MTIEGNIKIVIGSWGSYNECNERALGSKWLDLSDYSDWEEIQEELQKEGFILDGIDEELFIQDIEGLPSCCKNWDYTNPQKLFETLYESGVLEDEYQYDVLMAYLEVRDFDDFERLVDRHGSNWNDDIILYKGYDWEDYGRQMFEDCCCGEQIPDSLQDFFDFERYGEYCGADYVEEYSEGLIEIIR